MCGTNKIKQDLLSHVVSLVRYAILTAVTIKVWDVNHRRFFCSDLSCDADDV